MKRALKIWRHHGTKILGYATTAAGAIAVMDPELVTHTLGTSVLRWSLLATGILTAIRGHGNTARIKQELREQPAP